MWVALCGWPMILHLLISHFYPLQCDIISLTNLKITQAIRLLISFCKHGILLGLQYFKFLFIYERILNRIIIQIFGTFILSLVFAETVCDWICKNPPLHTKSEINFRPLFGDC